MLGPMARAQHQLRHSTDAFEIRFAVTLVRLQMGDTVRLEVRRPTGPFGATIVMAGFDRPVVRIDEVPGATERQRALRNQWLRAQD